MPTATPSLMRNILITGASSGIGLVAGLHLAARGYVVVGTSRRLERLAPLFDGAETLGVAVYGAELDVDDADSVNSVVPALDAQFGGIDALINNAGFGTWGPVEALSIDELKAQFETNFFGAVRMTQAVIPSMIERRRGRIVNVSSVLGRIGTPFNGAYVSSKYALEGISESLRTELRPFGVHVSLIEPGLYATDFQKNQVRALRATDPDSPYAPFIQAYDRQHDAFERFAKDPVQVARAIERAIASRRPSFRYPVGAEAWAATFAARLLPDRLFHALLYRATMGRRRG